MDEPFICEWLQVECPSHRRNIPPEKNRAPAYASALNRSHSALYDTLIP